MSWTPDREALRGRVAVVAGATVVCTGRSTRAKRSEYDRAETIEVAVDELRALPGPVVEVFCACDPDVARARYAARAAARHAGHFDTQHLEAGDLWSGEIAAPVAGGWPVVRIDTTHPLDVGFLWSRVGGALNAIGAGD